MLIRKGANLNDKNKEFLTSLHLAADKLHYDVMDTLLKHNCKVREIWSNCKIREIWSNCKVREIWSNCKVRVIVSNCKVGEIWSNCKVP